MPSALARKNVIPPSGEDDLGVGGALLSRKRRECVGDVGEHIEEVALFRVDDFLHLGELRAADALIREALEQLLARVRGAPQPAEFRFVLEEIGQLAEEHLHELPHGHRRAIGMPEGRTHHRLNGARLAVRLRHMTSN